MNEGALKYRIKRRILEKEKELIALFEKKGLHLIISPTDTGKTYSLMNRINGIFRLLAKLYPNRNFIIACPNKIQNEQNNKTYGVYALVGGVAVDISHKITSMVYEKSEEVIKEYCDCGKEFTLVIDEGHQLMYAENYRKEGIEALERLSQIAFNTIHITATARTLKSYYKYDSILEFELEEPELANNLEKLFVIPTDNLEVSLIHQIKAINSKGKQVLVLIDSKDSIEQYSKILIDNNLKVGMVTTDNKKGNAVYNSITNNSLIPANYDVVLGTSALECGTNLCNDNLVMIVVIPRRDRINMDKLEQSFARMRKKNEYAILLMRNYEQDEKSIIKDKKIIKKELEFEANRCVKFANNLIEFFKSQGMSNEDAVKLTRGNLNLSKANGTTVGMGIIDINDDNKAEINQKRFVVKVYEKYDAQFIDKKDKLIEYLKCHVKADKIIYADKYTNKNESDEEDIKKIKEDSKEIKEKLNNEARKIIMSYKDDIIFENYISCKETLELVDVSSKTEENLLKLEKQKKQLRIITDMVNKDEIPFKIAMDIYCRNEKPSDIKDSVRNYTYVRNNQSIPLGATDELNLKYEYGLIRRIVDPICIKQGKISERVIIEIVEDLMQYKEFTKYETYNKYKNAKDSEKEKRFEPIKNYIISRISKIYNISPSGQQLKVSSLKKTFNTV